MLTDDPSASQIPVMPKRKRWRKTRFTLLAFLLLAAIAIVAVAVWEWSAKCGVERQLANLRDSGVPSTVEELAASYRVPAREEDATEDWLQALRPFENVKAEMKEAGLQGIVESPYELPSLEEEWPLLGTAEKFVDRYRAALNRMGQLRSRATSVRFPIDFTQGYAAELPHLQLLRDAGRIIQLDIEVSARIGDFHRASQGIHNLHGLADTCQFEPSLVSFLIQIAMRGRANRCFERVGPLVHCDDDLEKLRLCWQSLDYQTIGQRALHGERIMGLQEVLSARILLQEDEPPALVRLIVAATRWHDAQSYLENLQSLSETFDGATKSRQVEGIGRASDKRHLSQLAQIMTVKIMPAGEAFNDVRLRAQAENDICLTLLAAEQYRRTHGSWPENVAKLVPQYLAAVPMDPFDGAALKYRVEEDCAIAYSVWWNGQDDDGDPWSDAPGRKPLDITYRIKAPAAPSIEEN